MRMQEITITRQQYEDQNHINDAYFLIRQAMTHLAQVQDFSAYAELHRVVRTMYEAEGVLFEHVANTDYVKVV